MAKAKKTGRKQGKAANNDGSVSYRLKCARSGNGLSHFVMYGDTPKGKTAV